MPTVSLTENNSLDDILARAAQLNMNSNQTLDLIWGAIDVVRGKSKRVFSYSDALDAQKLDCESNFNRSFEHQDWIDGESVVQAEQTSLEDGFNHRFHLIEKDLDSLSSNVEKAFACIAGQRSEISGLLAEVRAELNRINSDIHECCNKDEPFFTYPILPDAGFSPYYPPGGPFVGPLPAGLPAYGGMPLPIPGFGKPWAATPTYFHGSGGAAPWAANMDPVSLYIDRIENASGFQGHENQVVRSSSDPTRAVVAGLSAKLIEESVFNGNEVEVWSTNAGLILTPITHKEKVESRASWTHPSTDLNARFANWAERNAIEVRAKLGANFTTSDFVKAFGDEKLEGGLLLSQVLDRLPTDTKVKSATGFIKPLAEMAGKLVANEGLAAEAVIGAVGLNVSRAELAEAPASAFKLLPSQNASNLKRFDIVTMTDLSKASPENIVAAMKLSDSIISVEEAAGIAATATSLIAIDFAARRKF